MTGFTGFGPGAVAFFAGLRAENSKEYFQANRALFEAEAKAPMLAFWSGRPRPAAAR